MGLRLPTLLALLPLAVLGGCCGPFKVVTSSRVFLETPPIKDDDPIRAMRVEPGCDSTRRIALIDVDGLLLNANMTGIYSAGENPVALFREKLDHVARNPCYCAVVLRINSPGGGVTASDIMRRDLQRFRAATGKPVIACLMDLGAGGAYYLATAADHIVAHPTSITGGMGVILNLYNLQDAMAQGNIEGVPIKAGDNIDLGTPIETMAADSRKILQEIANEFHQRYRNAVRESRALPLVEDEPLFDGRIFTARQAAELHLIDSMGYLDDAVQMARDFGGAGQAGLYVLHRPRDRARTPYDITPNVPIQGSLIPISLPGLDRSKLPTFLYLWQPDPTLETIGGL